MVSDNGQATQNGKRQSPLGWLRRFLAREPHRASASERWPVVQVEVTSRCPMRCVFCPHQALGREWIHGDLPWQVFRDHIGPHLAHFDLVYLQGWGEPLLHPHLWDMIRLTKSAGCQVGFTTCGGLLNEENAQRLVDEGVDILSVSFAGATTPTHESLRVGSDFQKLTGAVERLAALRKGQGLSLPLLELHFLMMRPNIHELPAFVRLAASLGADEAVATNVAYAPTPQVEALRVFDSQPDPRCQAILAESEQEAERLGLRLRAYPLAMDNNILECDSRPTEMAFVNHLGLVTPCVYLGLPVQGRVSRYFEAEDYPVSPVSFGDVRDGLIEAMQGRPRMAFAAPFRARKASAYSALSLSAAGGAGGDIQLPEPPQVCRHCAKFYGI